MSLALGASRATERWISFRSAVAARSWTRAARRQRLAWSRSAAVWRGDGAAGGRGRHRHHPGLLWTPVCRAYDAEAIHLRTLSLESVDRLVARLAG